jgi:mRNA degradation ribonuclease J1/J2
MKIKERNNINLIKIITSTAMKYGKSPIVEGEVYDILVQLEQELLSRLEAGQKAIARYELIRRLSPREFSDIYQLNISTGKPFDEIVDNLLPFVRRQK